MKSAIKLKVNGDDHELLVSPNNTLLEVLREKLGLTGTKQGCDLGACGACTVLVDGESRLSCIMLAVDAVGKEIITIEGIEENGHLDPLQAAFVEKGGLQCGFCTPGMILTARSILNEEARPTEETIKRKMAGNLCRCTGYKKIVEAVMTANEQTGEGA
ncbi:MAG: (2Fe-2S)-binding protein [Proteobacteria bacterium]|jgi:carbon-monoxide dehydrogenase small subunit|nr:(2Fe-2S)-binding protein [Desulfobacterales bacterium]MBL7102015.1 (2Fe-2S)-binding protein [Desulfobacteraceae bacterium]MBL7172660.1 (2Fe-2S)-binding protein [Desulfobacteraceae bacterium]MBU0734311.1 (2Fe-2S)-binding protein [Pseudomonadota bacterium]MBU1903722.1 (2Fe-2S)-binding protein [Pseudomonadota bacterium]